MVGVHSHAAGCWLLGPDVGNDESPIEVRSRGPGGRNGAAIKVKRNIIRFGYFLAAVSYQEKTEIRRAGRLRARQSKL